MICEERFLKIILAKHISEKTSIVIEKNNTIVLKVVRDATKTDIKTAIKKLFEIDVYAVHTLIIKGKIKRQGKRIGRRNDWKKAYVTLKEGQQVNFIGGVD
ncbi:50S ribosomal protein L23 [Candidatus Profftia sp. (ex Adelges kitamiensis)]|uniref:50S ribosomal protein L23 n=1 Tax=Candidatus Profftia sp. (ex Adelges kitamiensis) TaxID=2864218 RepID=UPI001CE24F31|nr:50S ribosomal protein L23 [Candidatus Profftia sp. (ex Adelges kitamiensis)]